MMQPAQKRQLLGTLVFAIAIIGAEHVIGPRLVLNYTHSLPPGLYWRSPVPTAGPKRGDLVIACVPTAFARFGRERGFLDVGECDGTTTVLKIVVAVAGDKVHLDAAGVRVNGRAIPGSKVLEHDVDGTAIPHVAFGDYVLASGDVWLASPKPRSFDSRYYGPVGQVLAIARPFLIVDF